MEHILSSTHREHLPQEALVQLLQIMASLCAFYFFVAMNALIQTSYVRYPGAVSSDLMIRDVIVLAILLLFYAALGKCIDNSGRMSQETFNSREYIFGGSQTLFRTDENEPTIEPE